MSFAKDMARIAAKTNIKLEQLGRAVKIATFSGVIADTRVDTGRLRGNWQTSEGAPITTPTSRLDKSGSAATSDVVGKVEGISLSYLTNNLPYAPVWEERDAMVARNVATTLANVKKKAAELNR